MIASSRGSTRRCTARVDAHHPHRVYLLTDGQRAPRSAAIAEAAARPSAGPPRSALPADDAPMPLAAPARTAPTWFTTGTHLEWRSRCQPNGGAMSTAGSAVTVSRNHACSRVSTTGMRIRAIPVIAYQITCTAS